MITAFTLNGLDDNTGDIPAPTSILVEKVLDHGQTAIVLGKVLAMEILQRVLVAREIGNHSAQGTSMGSPCFEFVEKWTLLFLCFDTLNVLITAQFLVTW